MQGGCGMCGAAPRPSRCLAVLSRCLVLQLGTGGVCWDSSSQSIPKLKEKRLGQLLL